MVIDRDIDALLKLDKYDALTDVEVRKLIEYNVNQTKASESLRISKTTAQSLVESNDAVRAAICEDSNNVLQSIINSTTNYQGVAPTAVTNLLTAMEEV